MYIERAPIISAAVGENLKILKGGLVGLDIDAVTQATIYKALDYASLKLNRTIVMDELTDYWKLASMAIKNGMSEEEAYSFAKIAFNRNEVYQFSPRVPGIASLLKIFRDLEIPHVSISSRPSEFLDITKKWFFENFPWIDPKNIIMDRPRGMPGGDYKASVIEKEGVLLHIDDALEEVEIIVDKTRACILMPSLPWNIHKEVNHPRIKKVGNVSISNSPNVWPVISFLASSEAKQFLNLSVAQY
ncbi:hypothetical protein A2Z22_00355 [Candidatus Woesebacteria bacterium RBG_16_34_12]|uniref:Uncharacterized protein n=1 Tax=Candidatus Woesebacteria bacterium RBG_16_34_12 TaxID=1802480 RepID=A0A1F7X8Z0_9BACT|nr:MAG: hypothetical protein A2Z22_00355 [Candidatus Woesebacteria bacterium RBG_16_34_12]